MRYLLLITGVCFVVLSLSGVWYTNHVQQENNQKWCSLMDTMVSSYDTNPPTTPTGIDLAQKIRELRRNLGCE